MSKKESNPKAPESGRPNPPPSPPAVVGTTYCFTKEELVEVFDTWMRNYKAYPENFDNWDEDVCVDDGEACAKYFIKLLLDLEEG